ncbi:hypothetical protein X777_13220 [Ooceraea biroi]|uniref:Uncharacterized protein n=1 Tax=Ooceraea biroi TaxID=2015173 RepID=A0A026VXZ3_OOCBI|nr:hypothetical protein X777_13220 [Ooceraea biroi]
MITSGFKLRSPPQWGKQEREREKETVSFSFPTPASRLSQISVGENSRHPFAHPSLCRKVRAGFNGGGSGGDGSSGVSYEVELQAELFFEPR